MVNQQFERATKRGEELATQTVKQEFYRAVLAHRELTKTKDPKDPEIGRDLISMLRALPRFDRTTVPFIATDTFELSLDKLLRSSEADLKKHRSIGLAKARLLSILIRYCNEMDGNSKAR